MKKWQSNVELFLSMLSPSDKSNYGQLIDILVGTGYVPHKMRVRGLVMSFKNPAHNRVIANLGIRQGCEHPFFGLRFSACSEYPPKFDDVIRARISSSKSRPAKCGVCHYCDGPKHVYTCEFPEGTKAECGCFILEIPNINTEDIGAIRELIAVQNEYFMTYARKKQ